MGLSKSHRIILLLIIDTIFFFIELSVGYAVHSLALVADAFHMLNDVLSLCVGLWAVKVANQKTSSKMYTYGWQRAETLGALVNGVFLIALCLSIFLDAIQRFVEPQEVSSPKLVLIVGCMGLASNIVGLLLFHDHSHGHGGHSHGEEEGEPIEAAEQGYTTPYVRDTAVVSDQSGTVASVMPHNVLEACAGNTDVPSEDHPSRRRTSISYRHNARRFSGSAPRGYRDAESFYVHPASLRQDIIRSSRFEEDESTDSDSETEVGPPNDEPSERSELLPHDVSHSTSVNKHKHSTKKEINQDLHEDHNHAQPKSTAGKDGHGHSHDLNMRGVFLHVMGDALGNIGVISSALVIWLTDYSWRFYVDPGISLFITVIILLSAVPLCKAASRILLQAVPPGMSIDHIMEDIEQLPGVVSCHHLHVWQLSDTKLVASLHIQVNFDIKGEGSGRYMSLARHVRKCLHAYGIHSSTIQPEFHPESDVGEGGSGSDGNGGLQPDNNQSSEASSLRGSEQNACLLECGTECAAGRQCCS